MRLSQFGSAAGRRRWAVVAGSVAWLAAAPALLAQQPNRPPNHPGFPLTLPNQGTVRSAPLIANLGLSADGTKSIVFGTNLGDLHVIYKNSGGTWGEAPGFPVHVGTYIASSPAVGDLDGDGIPDIVVGWGDPGSNGPGGVKAYKRNGVPLWSATTQDRVNGPDGQPDPVVGAPAIGDVDGDGFNEVVFGSFDFNVYVLNGATGAPKPGWPKFIRDTIWSSPALHDIDGDGIPDIIIGVDAHAEGAPFNTPDGGCLHVLRFDSVQTCSNPSNPVTCSPPSEIAGFPKCVDQVIVSSPSVGDIDGDGKPEIVHGTGSFYGGPGHPGGTQSHKVYAWHCDGSAVAGWPVTVTGQSMTSPALGNLDADAALEVVVTDLFDPTPTMPNSGDEQYRIDAFKGNGTPIFSVRPKDFFGVNLGIGEPVIADVLGADAAPEILAPTNGSAAVLSAAGVQLSDDGSHTGAFDFQANTTVGGVAVGELDPDNAKIDVVVVAGATNAVNANTEIWVWNPISRSSTPPWGLFRQNEKRSGVAPATPSCSGGCTAFVGALNFFSITPCRLVDTRNANGPYGGPALAANQARNFTFTNLCNVPAGAKALSLNVTVTQPTGLGNISFSPGGCPPGATTTINFGAGQTRANNAVLPLAKDGSGILTARAGFAGVGSVHLIIDVNGYFQ